MTSRCRRLPAGITVLDLRTCNYYHVLMATREKTHRTATAIRFPDPLLDRLRDAAEDRDLSVNFLVVKAVEEFLDRLIPAEEFRLTRTG